MSDEPKKRSEGEKIRIQQSITMTRRMLYSLELSLGYNAPIGNDAAQAVMTQVGSLAMQVAKHDAYLLSEEDAEGKPPANLDFVQEGLEKRPFKRG